MSSLTRITYTDDNVIVDFGLSDDWSTNFANHEFGRSEHVSMVQIPSRIPHAVRHLEIYIGLQISNMDASPLYGTVQHVLQHRPLLETFSVTAYHTSGTWLWEGFFLARLLQRLLSPSHISFEIHIINSENHSALTICRRHGYVKTSVTLPLEIVGVPHVVEEVLKLPLTHLRLLPPSPGFSYLGSNNIFQVAALTRLLSRSRQLTRISLPYDFLADLAPLFFLISALPNCQTLKITHPFLHSLPFGSRLAVPAALVEGLYRFDHLRKLSLPADVLCDPLLDVLGYIQDLREVEIIARRTSVPIYLLAPGRGQFPSLCTLCVVGSLSDLKRTIRAFSRHGTGTIQSIYVDAEQLCHKEEMQKALRCITTHLTALRVLGIRIRGARASEDATWMNLSQVGEFPTIREFVIQHPRPLPLSDHDIRVFLQNWPAAEVVSFNPSPSLPPWNTPSGMIRPPPTLNCLVDTARVGGQLRNFGVYLNTRTAYASVDSALSALNLRVLDLGTSGHKARSAPLARRLFPNAALL